MIVAAPSDTRSDVLTYRVLRTIAPPDEGRGGERH